jgi:hypothetical protein
MVDAELPGDVQFPPWSSDDWLELKREHRPADAHNAHAMDFVLLARNPRGA